MNPGHSFAGDSLPIQKDNLHAPSMEPGKIMRATLGKSREERLISNHAGQTKRLVLTVMPNLQAQIETEFAAGNVWLRDRLIASAHRIPPYPECKKGKPARSWIDLRYLATILRVPEDKLTEQWNELMSPEAELELADGRTFAVHASQGADDDYLAPQLMRPNSGYHLPISSGRLRPSSAELTIPVGNQVGVPASSSAGTPVSCRNTFAPLLSDCHQEVEMTPEPSAPSCTPQARVAHAPTHVEIHIASWNIGGTSVEDAVQPTRRTAGPKKGIICLQEVPRQPVGWKTDVVDRRMTVVQYRHDDAQWRGNAIAFTEDCQVLRRRGCRFGMWLRLRHLPTENEMWVSSFRLSTGTTSDVTAEELRTTCALLPPTLLPTVMLGDFNTHLKWSRISGSQEDMRPTEARAEYVLSQLGGCGMRMRAPGPEQWDTPTSRPRRARAKGRRIDGVAYKGVRLADVTIEVDSFKTARRRRS